MFTLYQIRFFWLFRAWTYLVLVTFLGYHYQPHFTKKGNWGTDHLSNGPLAYTGQSQDFNPGTDSAYDFLLFPNPFVGSLLQIASAVAFGKKGLFLTSPDIEWPKQWHPTSWQNGWHSQFILPVRTQVFLERKQITQGAYHLHHNKA